MFPLNTAAFPSSAIELERLLNQSLQCLFLVENDPVSIRNVSYPHLDAIIISLDGARLRTDPPRPAVVSGETSPALEINHLTLSAAPLSLGPAAVNLSLSAREVRLGQGKDSKDQIVLTFQSAAEGNIEISAMQTDLEALIGQLAKTQAVRQGVTIDGVHLTLQQKNPQSLAAEVRLRVRKLFLSASIQVTGQFELDDQLNLEISDLNCIGDGAIATLVCGILQPYLQKIDGHKFSLLSLPLGEIHLRDVRVNVGDKISITAEFGSTAVQP